MIQREGKTETQERRGGGAACLLEQCLETDEKVWGLMRHGGLNLS